MSTTATSIWDLIQKAQLLSAAQCQQWRSEIAKAHGGKNVDDPKAIAEFLVGKNVLSKYQSNVLLAGRPGPFAYGDYKVYDKVDRGRLAGMFRAVHATTGHPVLLQFLSGPVTQNPQSWNFAANEARVAGRMVNPHLHRVFELCDTPKHKFVVWEDLRGQTLEERLAAGRMPPSEACRIARQIALALTAVHQGGRIHGDVRPVNVWCDHAKGDAPGNTRLLRDPMAMPTPLALHQPDPQGRTLAMADYAAPELQVPGAPPNVLTDVYALGCLLYQLLSGALVFAGGDAVQKMMRHGNEPPRPLAPLGVPPPIEQLVMYLLAKNPAMRYQDTNSVAEQLAAFVDPAVLRLNPPAPGATLVAYETALKQAAATQGVQAAAPMGYPPAAPMMPPQPAMGYGQPGYPPPSPAFANGPVVAPSAPPEVGPAIKTETEGATKSTVRRPKKKNLMPLWVTLASVGLFAVGGLAYWMSLPKAETEIVKGNGETENPVDVPPVDPSVGPVPALPNGVGPDKTKVEPPKTTDGSSQVVPDDGKTLWASPTNGQPLELKYFPPEAQVVFHLRPASLMATGEGPKVLKALGPNFPIALEALEKGSGLKFADLDRLVVSLHNNDGKFPKVACVATLKEGESAKALVPTWADVAEEKEGETAFHKGAAWSYYIPAETNDRVFAMADEESIREVIKNPDSFDGMKREARNLNKATDDLRHVTVHFNPNFFFVGNDADMLFQGELARGREGLAWILGDGVQAATVSLHFQDAFYFEMRAMSKIDKDKRELAEEFHKRFDTLPGVMRDYIAFQLNPPPYWKLLSQDFPRMIAEFHRNMRVGVEGDEAVFNCYLPSEAAHNLVLGTELAMATAPGAAPTVAAAGNGDAYKGPKTLDEAIATLKMSEFSFDSLSLEFAIRDLQAMAQDVTKGAPFPMELVIIGKDLELDGITRNQTIRDFKVVDAPLGDILTALVTKAHPKLIWAVGPHPDDEKKTVVILTTRTQAAKKNYKVPEVFKQ